MSTQTPPQAHDPESTPPRGLELLYAPSLSLATAALMFVTWPLWTGATHLPPVPFVRGWHAPQPAVVAICAALALVFASAVNFVRPGSLAARLTLASSVLLLGGLLLADQNRLQPWVYQYLILAVGWVLAPPRAALTLSRWFHASIYVHSGLSKLDASFASELGPVFVRTLARLTGQSTQQWSTSTLTALALALPATELMIGLQLFMPRLRRLGLMGALLLHAGILWMLSPAGLDHSLSVLAWNLALMTQAVLLFHTRAAGESSQRRALKGCPRLLLGFFMAALLMPFLERLGWWDVWPSFAVYASHVERVEVYTHENDLSFWPEVVQRQLQRLGGSPWLRIDMLGIARGNYQAPPYPQARVSLATAHALWTSHAPARGLRIRWVGRGAWFSGQRTLDTFSTLSALELRMRRFRLNAWPERSPAPGGLISRKLSES